MKKRSTFFSVFMMLAMLASLAFQVTPAYARPLSAGAGDGNTVLIYGLGTAKTVWNDQAVAAGFTVEVADDTAWNAKTTADFATYKAIIIPDNVCLGPSATVLANRVKWGAAVTGNILIIGGDPDYHAPGVAGATQLIYNGIKFAGADSTGKTGALIPLGCGQDVSVLDPFGAFTGRSYASDNIHMVASHPALTGLTDAALSNWGSSTHTAFTSFPAGFIPLAIQNGATGTGVLSFPDGTSGTPYLLAKGEGLAAVGSPTITSIVPTSGSAVGGTSVVITGTDFTGATTFTFGGTDATCTVDSDTQITCTSPAHSAGTVDVVVTTPGGTATSTGGYTYTTPVYNYNLTVSGTYNYPSGNPAMDIATGLAATSTPAGGTLDGAIAFISAGFQAGDTLSVTDPSGVTSSYDADSGVLALSGTADVSVYQTVLGSIKFSTASTDTTPRTVTYSLGTTLPSNPCSFASSHFYDFILGDMSWTAAQTAASGLSYFGRQGYLTTVTCAAENTLIAGKLSGEGWMGASDQAVDGTWNWMTGPEAGTTFCSGEVGTCVPFGESYTNWDDGEPNGASDEDYGHFLDNGLWNDYPLSIGIAGYVVEYGGMLGDTPMTILGNVTVNVTVTGSAANTTTAGSSATPADLGDTVTLTATVSDCVNLDAVHSIATGTVEFWDGGTLLGTSTLSGLNPNTATTSFSPVTGGTHPISVFFSGDSVCAPSSNSPAFDQIFNTPIDAYVAGDLKGSYSLASGAGLRQIYGAGTLNSGPAKVTSTFPPSQFVASERVIYNLGGAPTSFSEMMGQPGNDLSDSYLFPWYNNVDLDTQLRIANLSGAPDSVHVFIGGTEMTGSPFALDASGAGQSVRLSFPGVNTGPVKVFSQNVGSIVASERVIYKVAGAPVSFSEMMGLPAHNLNSTYWFPWYNNVDLDSQLRFSNLSEAPVVVHVKIGGIEVTDPALGIPLADGASTRVSFGALNTGPVEVYTENVLDSIVASMRVIYKVNGQPTSFSEMMGLPDRNLNTDYWFPWYNNVDLDTQLRIGNVSGAPASVHVLIGGVEVTGSPFALTASGAGQSMRLSFDGVNSGQMELYSGLGEWIVASLRVIHHDGNGTPTSFSEMMGLPSHLLDSTYWFPWYNNIDLDSQLRFSVP